MSGTGPARWFEREPLALFESRGRHTVDHRLNLLASPGRGAPPRATHSHTITVAVLNTQGMFAICSDATKPPLRARTTGAAATEQTSHQYLAVAAQLVEAACCARVADGAAARSHIGNALASLTDNGLPRLHRRASRKRDAFCAGDWRPGRRGALRQTSTPALAVRFASGILPS
jgi:hypothetical protein